jgi:hypothetical protein
MRPRTKWSGRSGAHSPDIELTQQFWTTALGVALEGHATGRSAGEMSAAMREALGELAEARTPRSAGLQLVAPSEYPSTKTR